MVVSFVLGRFLLVLPHMVTLVYDFWVIKRRTSKHYSSSFIMIKHIFMLINGYDNHIMWKSHSEQGVGLKLLISYWSGVIVPANGSSMVIIHWLEARAPGPCVDCVGILATEWNRSKQDNWLPLPCTDGEVRQSGTAQTLHPWYTRRCVPSTKNDLCLRLGLAPASPDFSTYMQ